MATKTIGVEQRFELLAKLAAHLDWDSIDSRSVQEIIDHPAIPGQQFTLFLKNGCRFSFGDLKIAPAPFDPVAFISKGWNIVLEEHDKMTGGLVEVDFNQVDFEDCLEEGETMITGEVKLTRLKERKRIRYGAVTFMGLLNDYQTREVNSVLETLFRTKSIVHLDFFGDVLLGPNGNRCVLCLDRVSGGRWIGTYRPLAIHWYRRFLTPVCSQVSV